MDKRIYALAKIGIATLIVSVLCVIPVLANTVPVTNLLGEEVGTLTFTLVPDKAVYLPGDKITFKLHSNETEYDDLNSISIWRTQYLEVTLDPNIIDISLDNGGFGSPCSITGNTLICENYPDINNPYWDDRWRIGYGQDYPHILGTIKPGTPSGTKIKTSGYIWQEINFFKTLTEWPSWCDDTNTVTVSIPNPEFPSIIYPVFVIIGILGGVLFIRRFKEQ